MFNLPGMDVRFSFLCLHNYHRLYYTWQRQLVLLLVSSPLLAPLTTQSSALSLSNSAAHLGKTSRQVGLSSITQGSVCHESCLALAGSTNWRWADRIPLVSLLLVFTYHSQVALFGDALLFEPTLQRPNIVYGSVLLGIDSLYIYIYICVFSHILKRMRKLSSTPELDRAGAAIHASSELWYHQPHSNLLLKI